MIEFLDRVENIRQQLEDFDRELSDNIRPLALFFEGFDMDGKGTFEEKQPGDPLTNNFVYQKVIDQIATLNLANPSRGMPIPEQSAAQFNKEYREKVEKATRFLHETLNLV